VFLNITEFQATNTARNSIIDIYQDYQYII